MSLSISQLEPPSIRACHVDVQCMYADVTVPSDQSLHQWAAATTNFLVKENLLEEQDFEIAILVVDKVDSQFLNNQYRQKDSPTNVLSFPFDVPNIFKQHQTTNILGDIIICAPIIEVESDQQNKSIEEHWAHMVVHGVLHLLGYDHLNNADANIMEGLEIKILSTLGYTNPYLEHHHE